MTSRPFRISRRTVALGGLLGAGLAAGACGQNAAPLDDQGRVRLRLVLDGPADAAHGGFFQGLASGHYQRRNLTVEIMPGGPGVSAPALLASNAVELAIGADSFSAFSLIASGAPVRAVAAYFQKDTHVLVADATAPIETPADIGARPVVVATTDAATTWPVMTSLYGLAPEQRVTPASGEEAAAFADDPQALWLTDLRDGAPDGVSEAAITLLADHDYPAYGGLLLAPEGFARDNAEALRAFIIASAEGWRDYLGRDPGPADALIRAANPQVDPAALTALRQRLIGAQIVQGGEAAIRGIGVMREDRWRALAEAAIQADVLSPRFNWRDAYTLDYLPGRR